MNNPDLLSFAPHALNPMKLSVQAIIQKLGVLAHPREKVKRTKIILRKRFPALRLVELNHSTAIRWEIHHPPLGLLRSEEHTSELQSRGHIVCRLLLENNKLLYLLNS